MDRFYDRDESRQPRHLRIHRLQTPVLRGPISNFTDVKVPPFWDVLAERGVRSIIINQPSTYPARRMNGIMISGFVAVDLAKAVWPLELKEDLEQIGLPDRHRHPASRATIHAFLWQELDQAFMGRQKALNMFWEDEWDYFQLVLTGTDRLHHYLWNAGQDPDHPQHQNVLEYYRQIDRLINKIYSTFRKTRGRRRKHLLPLATTASPGSFRKSTSTPGWKKRTSSSSAKSPAGRIRGYLRPRTMAFALDPNRIYHPLRASRYPNGQVQAERGQSRSRKRSPAGSRSSNTKGDKVSPESLRRSRTSTPALLPPSGPDLIVVPEPGFRP
ncbi:MAG: alkaline phosphatase family protein [Candidatus Moduliflexus flocculans]|nr:alkaline phosphatase family protein [Candidatus Moduliflexus flocculans]